MIEFWKKIEEKFPENFAELKDMLGFLDWVSEEATWVIDWRRNKRVEIALDEDSILSGKGDVWTITSHALVMINFDNWLQYRSLEWGGVQIRIIPERSIQSIAMDTDDGQLIVRFDDEYQEEIRIGHYSNNVGQLICDLSSWK